MKILSPTNIKRSRHPCFDASAKARCGRLHLPVAPSCNIKCAYCNGKHDCPNENRPGLASRVIDPEEVRGYLEPVLALLPCITVVGIAGPGDPFQNPERTLTALADVRAFRPDLLLCVATNGLNIAGHLDSLVSLGVGFVTITINAVDPEIGKRIYTSIRDEGRVLQGTEAAGTLIDRQLAAVAGLKARGVMVKVNTVVVPGVNAEHVPTIAQRLAPLRVDLMNLIPLIPLPGTPLGKYPAPSTSTMDRLRMQAGLHIPQMRHCARCRADAAGLLSCHQSTAMKALQSGSPTLNRGH